MRRTPPIVALDVSLSWTRASTSDAWERARSRAVGLARDSVLLVGHTVRYGAPPASPGDSTALLGEAAQRAQLAGRPLHLISDGESPVETATLRAQLPARSLIEVIPVERGRDIAIAGVDMPPAAVAGDTLLLRTRVVAAAEPPAAVELLAAVDGRLLARRELAPFAGWETRSEEFRVVLPSGGARATVAVILAAADDSEPRNDTASRVIHRGERLNAVAVSTAPDVDFREIVRVMRGTLSLPVAARFRIAPARWIDDGGQAVPETRVRAELRAAQIALIHGDTAFFGSPRGVTEGALALLPPAPGDGEWYVRAAAPSPLASALGELPFDSLPPIAIGSETGAGTPLLEVEGDGRRRALVGSLDDSVRRVIVLPSRGTSRWALRGGAAGDGFTLLWGSVFAALSERPGRRFATTAARIPPRELQPQPAVLESERMPGAVAGTRVPLRASSWPYVLLTALLCTEWLLRRRVGLR